MNEKLENSYNIIGSKRLLSKKVLLLSGMLLFLGLVQGIYYSMHMNSAALELEYKVTPVSLEKKLIRVTMKMDRKNGSDLELYKSDAKPLDITAENSRGERLMVSEKDGFIRISSQDNLVTIQYDIVLGDLGKHGHRGGLYRNLMVFDGEQVFLFPSCAYTESEADIKKSFKTLSVNFDIPDDWISSVPFAKPLVNSSKVMTFVDTVSRSKIYELKKACYAFGKLKKLNHRGNENFNILIDPERAMELTDQDMQGINALYDYYTRLFGKNPGTFSLILFGTDFNDHGYIMGGSSSQTLGTTFDPGNKRDWELMGHRLFHAFFDHVIPYNEFHAPPQLWFYEGLATYYENMSVDSLSGAIKKRIGFSITENFNTLFKRYLYIRLKDPGVMAFAPMDEEKLLGKGAEIEFLHYTQAPLIIKAVEDINNMKTGQQNQCIQFILGTKKMESLERIMKHVLGEQSAEFSKKYLFGNEILPLWNLPGCKEDASQVVKEINDFEYVLSTWFRLENADYPMDILNLKGLDKLSEIAVHSNLHFASKDLETKVKTYSPTVYQLLMEYALRANVCGVSLSDQALRFKLLGNKSKVALWQDYVYTTLGSGAAN